MRQPPPAWLAGVSTITALIPYRRGLLPSVGVFIAAPVGKLTKKGPP